MDKGNSHLHETLVDEASSLLLRAISHSGAEAIDAFRRWRSLTSLDSANYRSRRVLPLLGDIARREGLADPDLNRINGVSRHIWTQNTLNERVLLEALDALASDGVRSVLLKSAALFARSREFMGKRMSSDSDVLVRPDELERAAAALRRCGFQLKEGHHWDDLAAPLIDSESSGVGMRHAAHRSEVDLHWRPLWNIRDASLTETVFARAEGREVHGRSVLIPSVTDQFFLALARCEPWDEDESFGRLIEARLLLSAHASGMDWPVLARSVTYYGLEATARAFLGDLERYGGLEVPPELRAHLEAELSAEKRAEWEIRRIPPERRSERQRWALQKMDRLFHRGQPRLDVPTRREMRFRLIGLNVFTAGALWQALRKRMRPGPVGDIQFLEGFSSPEKNGRWSTGRWSAIAVPLSPEQQAGEPVHFNALAFLGRAGRARIAAQGGRETFDRIQLRSDAGASLSLRVRPLPELAGAGLILFWLPNAQSPHSAGLSNDRRDLGLFIRREWQSLGGCRHDRTVPGGLWDLYRRLPLPQTVRRIVSPMLRKIESSLRSVQFRTPSR